MPVTSLDPRTALIIVDLQKGIVGLPTAHPIDEVVKNACALADAFRSHGQPVVLVNVSGGPSGRTDQAPRIRQFPDGWMDLIPELTQQPEDILITKRTWGSFSHTDLEDILKKLDVTQVVIAGVATTAGVESTARQAHEFGFHVTLAIDAMTDMNADAHHNSVTRIFPRIAETGTTKEILDHLAAATRA